MNKHKWYEVILAWASGERIQYRYSDTAEWIDEDHPTPPWASQTAQFRVKPAEPTIREYYTQCQLQNAEKVIAPWQAFNALSTLQEPQDNLKLTFKDNKLIKAELV